MSEPPGSQDSTDPSSPLSGGIAGIERAFLRLTFWQTLLSLAGVFTGAVALYAALNESQAVREQTAASVWPYAQLMINDTDNGEQARFALSIENVGVGPARMRGARLRVDGQVLHSWEAVSQHVLGEVAQVGVDFGRSSVGRRVIAPGESIIAFQTTNRPLALAMQQAVYEGRTSLEYCYCSIFEHCWTSGLGASDGDEPTAVEQCPDYGVDAFRD